ncbi:PREDICTED: LOW QUALITY PROTEIN: guanylate-binding protein 4-like [Galeopterus variegatus]|uniref:LOW QUALITY PROTEIN: guanylate-binding protein 4-like n=1 Tax=Galeopterus variegatus TaxID=482537 RepID=A0ABM0RS19_GALVR|nr:PREDICTED: LOW QUALITY PROTEIN: guanylate-binding protein 4-like [Galeopterus variegatus]
MASKSIMMAPICLVKNWKEQLMVDLKALQILDKISQPVVVVAIAGLYRTGKSYLMNHLAGQNHESVPLVPKPSSRAGSKCNIKETTLPTAPRILVNLVEHNLSNSDNESPDNQLSASDQEDLEEAAAHYHDDDDYSVLTVSQKLKLNKGHKKHVTVFKGAMKQAQKEDDFSYSPVSYEEDEPRWEPLPYKQGKNPKIQNSNMPRECIRHFFPKRKCFVFDRPVRDKNQLIHIGEVPENQLETNYYESENFCSYIFTHAKTKTLREGIIVTGNRLGTLVVTYVDAINSRAVPCLENAVTTLAQRENAVAVQKAADHYSEQMAQRMCLPTDTLQELLDVHAACEREALAVFMERSFKDNTGEFQKKLVDTIEKKKEDFSLQNEEASVKYCQAELKQLSEPLMESISKGNFSVPRGHNLYLEAKKNIERGYKLVPRKGVKANEVLQNFLQSQVATETSILQSDKALTDGEKATAAEWAKKEAAEKEQELLRQKQKEQQQMMEAQERSFQENMAQLEEKMERERENLLREQERMLEHKLKVQEELLTEGFKKKSEELNKEINQLKQKIESTKEPCVVSNVLDMVGNLITTVLPAAAKLVCKGLKCLSSMLNRLRIPGKEIAK